jgi:pimeloyl-ACP methyl ester carboxylesterase
MQPRARKRLSIFRMGKLFFLLGFIVYFFFCMCMAFAQRAFLYHPQVFDTAMVERMAQSHALVRWTNAAGMNIGFKRMSPRQPSEGSIMMMYGNGSTATDSGYYADNIQNVAALDMYILEYPGYEDRPGKPTEKGIFAAAREGLELVPTNKPIYLLGESLGTGVASYLAGTYTNHIAGMILISPFNKLASVAQYHFPILPAFLFLVDRYPSEVYLRNYHGKVGVTVDGRDIVVPQKFGLRLYNSYNGPKKLWEFPEGGHCEIREPAAEFWTDAIQFLKTP